MVWHLTPFTLTKFCILPLHMDKVLHLTFWRRQNLTSYLLYIDIIWHLNSPHWQNLTSHSFKWTKSDTLLVHVDKVLHVTSSHEQTWFDLLPLYLGKVWHVTPPLPFSTDKVWHLTHSHCVVCLERRSIVIAISLHPSKRLAALSVSLQDVSHLDHSCGPHSAVLLTSVKQNN